MPQSQNPEKARQKLLQAGRIAAQALTYTCKLVKHNSSLFDIAEAGEQYIHELGGKPAFPINISIDYHAAHYTPVINDSVSIPEKALVKIDLGVQVDGYIADTARSVIVGEDPHMEKLKAAAEAGLKAAIATVRSGIRVWDISRAVSKAIQKMGSRAIENLTGHRIERFTLHAGISVPSVAHPSERLMSPRLQEGMVIAIEPFTTNSQNPYVVELERGGIFGFAPLRNPIGTKFRQLFSQMKMNYAQLPFASRWLREIIAPPEINKTLSALEREGCIHNYPVLGLIDKSLIAQAEHTLIVEKDTCTVTTLPG
ncbi:MAG: type II methionyl aminopeptidase [Promethearchaeota archaeon]